MEEFTYDIPKFLQCSFKANGPPDLPCDVPPTSLDCLVPIYVDSWWEQVDLRSHVGKPRDWDEMETFSLYCHSDMVSGRMQSYDHFLNKFQLSQHYNTGTDPQVSSVTLELNRMKQIRESIACGGRILEVKLERLTEKLSDLEERLQDSMQAIEVLMATFREM